MKIKGTWVEIIDLKLRSSLKRDGVSKKGASWAGTRLWWYEIQDAFGNNHYTTSMYRLSLVCMSVLATLYGTNVGRVTPETLLQEKVDCKICKNLSAKKTKIRLHYFLVILIQK